MSELVLRDRVFDPADGISLAAFMAKKDPADWETWEWRERPASGAPWPGRSAR
jgi:hypothetical protein